MGSGVQAPGRADGTSTDDEAWMARREAATVARVRSRVTAWGLAWARSLPCDVMSSSVGSCGLRLAWRKALRRLVRRRGGVGGFGWAIGQDEREAADADVFGESD